MADSRTNDPMSPLLSMVKSDRLTNNVSSSGTGLIFNSPVLESSAMQKRELIKHENTLERLLKRDLKGKRGEFFTFRYTKRLPNSG